METLSTIGTLSGTIDALTRANEADAIKIVVKKLLEYVNKI